MCQLRQIIQLEGIYSAKLVIDQFASTDSYEPRRDLWSGGDIMSAGAALPRANEASNMTRMGPHRNKASVWPRWE